MVDTDGEFISPPEAPVFEPTWEEFQDPLGYINKVRPIAEKSGICKIRPPPDWQPPFAVDVENFKFTPRVQRLNELEAKTRIKLNFLDKLAKFWELQGSPLKIPLVERKYLDLYQLQKTVHEEGGFEQVCQERKWARVSARLNYPQGKGIGSCLRSHYEKIVYPFDIFQIGATVLDSSKEEEDIKLPVKEEDCAIVKIENLEEGKPESSDNATRSRRSKRIAREISSDMMGPDSDSKSLNKELLRLQFKGAGPKMAVPEDEDEETKKNKMKTRDKKGICYVDQYMCQLCGRGDGEDRMLLCDSCDNAFHTYCLIPPLNDIPKGDWRCPKCVAKVCNKPKEAYGFEQAKKEYTLQVFGEMADQFKLDYFNMPVHMVPCTTVEREFWRLVNCIEEDVVVEYGADIHAMDNGSGFPTEDTRDQFPDDEEYIKSGWNLNNLPVLDQSVLRHITADISGMKIPWCYVGMCFSSFCWHIEDHWSYSINYMHWGEPKTWYGVAGAKAELLEECMKKNAPELFEQSPDLLHQLTTIMNPNILMAYGVPIVRTDQCAGEFVVTFPRAYHAGFNQGYNFAEAVNFCPADWIAKGYNCIEHYRVLHRQCVFSHDELVCKMAADPDSLDLNLAAAIHQNMLTLVDEERRLRKALLDRGTDEAEREAFELLPDDERQCDFCKTTCFLSAVTCPCSPNKLVCIYHPEKLCSCAASNQCLRYRYTLDELPAMLHKLKVRAEAFDSWAYKVKQALDAEMDQKLELADMKEFVSEAREKRYPDTPLLQALLECVTDAEQCANVAAQLVSEKVRTRHRQAGESKYVAKLRLDELQAFNDQIQDLPCKIKEASLIQDLLNKVIDFQKGAQEALVEDRPNSEKLDSLLELGLSLDIELPEVPRLKQVLHQARWLDSVRESLREPESVTLETMRKLIEAGVGLAPHPACEKAMADLQELLTVSERIEEKARVCLQARPRHVMATLDAIVTEAHTIPAYLPNIIALHDALRKAKEWTSKVEALQAGEHYPYLDVLESLVTRGRPIPVRLDSLPQLESQVTAAKSWRERTARTFLKKNSTHSLLEVLSPRPDVGVYQSGKMKRKRSRDTEKDKDHGILGDLKIDEQRDPAAIVNQFKLLEQREFDAMVALRGHNLSKQHEDLPDSRYCVCRKGPAGFMLQCELCKDWFHSTCVPLPKSNSIKSKNSHAAAVQAARDLKFLCPLCLRSRRPRLETILSLLVSLQKLPVRLPEGEALQCLTERAMAWQDQARQALATDELASALAKLSVLSQRMVEQAAREKTEKIISAELLKVACNPELQSHLQNVSGMGPVGSGFGSMASEDEELDGPRLVPSPSPPPEPTPEFTSESASQDLLVPTVSDYNSVKPGNDSVDSSQDNVADPMSGAPSVTEAPAASMFVDTITEMDNVAMETVLPPESPLSMETASENDPLVPLGMSSEHAYSTASKSMTAPGSTVSPRAANSTKQPRKSALIPRAVPVGCSVMSSGESPVLELSNGARQQLDELMMKGDLLEVSLDETQHIWRILQACMTSSVDKILQYQELEAEINKEKVEKLEKREKKKKRKLEGLDGKDLMKESSEKGKKKKLKLKEKDGKEKMKFKDGEKKVKDGEKKKKKKIKKRIDGKQAKGDVIVIDDDNNDDDCSAIKCIKPSGEEVNWVQCDRCELWFHLLCVGLGEDEVSENEDYVCYQCTQRENPKTPQPKTTSYKDFLGSLEVKIPSPLPKRKKKVKAKATGSAVKPVLTSASKVAPPCVEEDEILVVDAGDSHQLTEQEKPASAEAIQPPDTAAAVVLPPPIAAEPGVAVTSIPSASSTPAVPAAVIPASVVPAAVIPAATVPSAVIPAATVPTAVIPAATVPAAVIPTAAVPAALTPVDAPAVSVGPAATVNSLASAAVGTPGESAVAAEAHVSTPTATPVVPIEEDDDAILNGGDDDDDGGGDAEEDAVMETDLL